MRSNKWMATLVVGGVVASLIGGLVVIAAPPGPIDGQNIPANFGVAKLEATQESKTGFGDQTVTSGGLTNGSELDALYLAKTGSELKVGITGNFQPPNHVHIFIGDTGDAALGHTELKAAGDGTTGPPYTIQNMSFGVVFNTNGPGDPGDDTCDITSTGTIMPCTVDFALSLDAWGGNLSVSEYTFYVTSNGTSMCDEPNVTPTYSRFFDRVFVTQTPVSDTDGQADSDQGFGYLEIGLDNGNVLGVTDSDGSSALTAVTGLEMTIPFARLGVTGTDTITVLVTLTGDQGYLSAQMLPAHPTCTTEGDRPDLSGLGNCLAVNLGTLPAWTGGVNDSDGIVNPAHYGGATAAVQNCPTDFGDQQVNPNGVTLTGGSELNELFVTNDNDFLYVGLTGNLESNNNGLLLFIDSVAGGQGSTGNELSWDGSDGGGRLQGMSGSHLPLDCLDQETDYDYVYEINGSLGAGDPATDAVYYADLRDLINTNSTYMGLANVNSNGDEFFADAGNTSGFVFAYNFLNSTGVLGCGDGDPCDVESNSVIAARAATSNFGFEIQIPLVDIGITALPTDVNVFAFVTNGDGGWGSNQSLPSLRDPTGAIPGNPSNCPENAGGNGAAIDFSNDGNVGFCSVFPPDDPDCQYAYFARSACVALPPALPVCWFTDINCDGTTDNGDYLAMTAPANWGQDPPLEPRTELNAVPPVDNGDYLVLTAPANWGKVTGPCTCP